MEGIFQPATALKLNLTTMTVDEFLPFTVARIINLVIVINGIKHHCARLENVLMRHHRNLRDFKKRHQVLLNSILLDPVHNCLWREGITCHIGWFDKYLSLAWWLGQPSHKATGVLLAYVLNFSCAEWPCQYSCCLDKVLWWLEIPISEHSLWFWHYWIA